ncbi:MAG: phytanoyl-CoA dioxygenase family protein [Alphaproteobacteria bacterium]|nr:phytanoyl-CoA dioxygenase family protein [Alphaproteobacteria bacterium]
MTVGLAKPAPAQSDIEAYRRDGAVCLRGAFGPRWLDVLATGVEREMANPGPIAKDYTAPGKGGRFFGSLVMWQRVPEFEDFVRNSGAAAIAGAFMGAEKVVFYHDQLLVKEPGTAERTPWHHDQPYYFVDGRDVLSIWLPLDPVPRATCPEFVAGSHRWGRWFAPRYFIDGANYYRPDGTPFEPVPDIDGHRADYRILSWDLEPGDAIVFHGLTLHGAPGNASTRHRRRGYAIRWLGDDARFAERPGEVSPPIEGHGLAPGDPLDKSPMFPVVWRRP